MKTILKKILLKNKYGNGHHKLLCEQSLPLKELQGLQLKKLNLLLQHAYEKVPEYRKRIRLAGLVENEIVNLTSVKQLSEMKILSKKDIIECGSMMTSSDISTRQAYLNSTGGSTGTPLSFYQDNQFKQAKAQTFNQVLDWRKVSPYDDRVDLWGAERDTFIGKKGFIQKLKEFSTNRIIHNSFNMKESDIIDFLQDIKKRNPSLLVAYSNALHQVAVYAKQNEIKMPKLSAIHCAAGPLHEFMRKDIEAVFGNNIYNHYGTREVSSIASECDAHSGMHILMMDNIVEIVDDNGLAVEQGLVGKVLITNLNNFSMPLIRYDIGDLGYIMKSTICSCGCSYPKLGDVQGRTGDVFISSSGNRVLPEFFIHLVGVVNKNDSISKFQFIQNDLDKLELLLVCKAKLDNEYFVKMKSNIESAMGVEIELDLLYVDDIPQMKNGKHQYTRSLSHASN
ncbi:phenylacetate--CoA ligase family protein [Shewanella sp. MMG014]|uniref:phenylacetate--CoA ligase family protein n=1 Tax=Shewanella sp. MMG014 TaxID=2822691 RepID=UPI001B35DB82|nr:AMP-binding protein [Shewanella sp. MMG014]MBQ4888544.1 phenylacetate--CoA ligase family protein [Shewanella sp. MMG014]